MNPVQRPHPLIRWLVAMWRLANQERDKRIAASAEQRGRLKEREAIQATMPPIFGERPVYIPVAMLPSYELPDKQTDAIRPVLRTAKLLPLENVIGPTSTQSLPAIDPKTGYYVDHPLMRKAIREQQRRAGK